MGNDTNLAVRVAVRRPSRWRETHAPWAIHRTSLDKRGFDRLRGGAMKTSGLFRSRRSAGAARSFDRKQGRRRGGGMVLSLVLPACLALLPGCGDGDSVGSAGPPLNPDPALVIGAAQQRPARVVLPADYNIERRYPLVILLHGFAANVAAQEIVFGLASRTTDKQFILVLPNGSANGAGDRFWDATPECCNFGAPPVDDVGYLAALMREAMATYAVDPKRIRLVGHSNGGYMSYRYACEHPVPVDRIVVLAGSTVLEPEQCRDPQPIDVLHIHGTADKTILYGPNLPPDNDSSKVTTVGAEAAVGHWARLAGCDDEPQVTARRDHHQRLALNGDPAETEILQFRNCASGKSVELWRSIGAAHLFVSVNDLWRDDVAAFLAE